MKGEPSQTDKLSKVDFLWGWLCVNTRDLYYDVGDSLKDNNITLAPIIDLVCPGLNNLVNLTILL